MSDEELLFLLQSYDAQVMYDPADDPDGSVWQDVMRNTFHSRQRLRQYLMDAGLIEAATVSPPRDGLEAGG